MESTNKVPLKEATREQMMQFGQTVLGLSIPGNIGDETLRAKITEVWDKDDIVLPLAAETPASPEGDPPAPVTEDQQAAAADKKAAEKVTIILQRTEDAGGDEPVPVSVNGKCMLIPRGEEATIPRPYYEVLKNAVTHRYESVKDGGINPTPRKVPAYPFQVVSGLPGR